MAKLMPGRQRSAVREVPQGAVAQCMATKRPAAQGRAELLRSTALQAVFLAAVGLPAAAQTPPSANALPTGGQVIAGQASISQAGAKMTVTQGTAYGAVNWQSFDIGKNAAVTFAVPTPRSVTLNRVVTPTPSVIAGKLSSNGVVVVQNQSGVVFTQGAEVNVQTLIATTAGVSDANARAGRLIFDQPSRPGAKVENRGTITVAETGLAALVAPQVANSGVIRARMGRVVLAGAEAHTVDLYGDGLLSIEVTKQVSSAPVGPDGKAVTALVTNSGTIIADGGTILLTARAVDGLVQNLVTAGGTVRANTVGSRTGSIVIEAKGGNVAVSGKVSARGNAPGRKGGQVEINAPSRNVTLTSTAVVNASGRAGGGSVAIGTSMSRAKGGPGVTAPTARNVTLASGSKVAANATRKGKGGDVTVLSAGGVTEHRGTISAKGGSAGGDGGFVEVSGSAFVLKGDVDVTAPFGRAGSILLDPNDLVIADSGETTKVGNKSDKFTSTGGKDVTVITADDIVSKMSGAVTIQTGVDGTLTVDAVLDVTKSATITSLTLLSQGDLTINKAVTGKDDITLRNTQGNLAINAAVTTAGDKTIVLDSVTGSIALGANLTAGAIDLNAGSGGVAQTAGQMIAGAVLSSKGINGTVDLAQPDNAVSALGDMKVTGGDLLLVSKLAVTQAGAVSAGAVSLTSTAAGVALQLDGTVSATTSLALIAGSGSVAQGAAGVIATPSLTTKDGGNTTLAAAGNKVDAATFISTGAYALASKTGVAIGGTAAISATVSAPSVDVSSITAPTIALTATAADISLGMLTGSTAVTLTAAKDIAETAGGAVVTPSLSTKDGGNSTLAAAGNKVDAATFTSAGAYALASSVDLIVSGTASGAAFVDAPAVTVPAGGIVSAAIGVVADTLDTTAGALDAGAGVIEIAPRSAIGLTLGTAVAGTLSIGSGDLASFTAGTLRLGGTVSGGTKATQITVNAAFGNGSFAVLDLRSAGTIGQGAAAALTAVRLEGSAGGAVTLASAGNAIDALGSFDASGQVFSLATQKALAQSGTLAAGAVSLTSTAAGVALQLDGTVSATTSLALIAGSGSVAQGAAGAIATPSLTTKDGGDTTLAAVGNKVVAATFTSAGAYALASTTGVAIGGTAATSATVSAPSVDVSAITAPTIALTATAADITLGTLTGSTAVTLAAAKDIAEAAGGAVVTPSLSTKDDGNTTLAAAGNKVDAATFTSAGAYALSSTTGVAIGGTAAISATVSAPSVDVSAITAPTIALTATAADITLGALTGSTAVTLTAAKDITETAGGALVTPSLSTKDGGNTTLAAAGNKVDAATFTSTGAYALSSTTVVAIGGTAAISATVSAPSVDVSAITAPTIALTATAADITLGTLTGSTAVTLTAAKDIAETAGGAVVTPSLSTKDGGNTTLAAAGNKVDAATFTSAGAYALASSVDLIVSGTASGAAFVDAPAVTVPAGGIVSAAIGVVADTLDTTAGALDAGAGVIEIAPRSAIGLTLGTAVAGTLSIGSGDLASFTAGTLRLGGTVSGGTKATQITVNAAFGNGSFAVLDLRSAGTIGQGAAAALTAVRLEGSAGGAVTLASAGNAIDALGSFDASGQVFSLATQKALAQSGTLAAGAVSLTSTAAGVALQLDGTVSATTSLALIAGSGSVAQGAAGAIATPSLTTKDGGDTTLAAVGNKVVAATFTSAGAYALASTTGVAIGGTAATSATVSAPSVDVSAITAPTIALTATAADITLGTLTGSTAVTLAAAKDIAEAAGGAVVTPSLSTKDDGNTTLAAAGNKVDAATFTSTGAYALSSTTGVAIGGTAAILATVSAPSVDVSSITAPTIALTATAADVTLGALTGSTAVTLTAAKAITETAGGALVTPSLTTKDGGNTTLAAAGNKVDAATFTSTGAYALSSTTGVAIGGTAAISATVSAPSVDVSAITAPTIALTATAADINLGALTGSTEVTLTAAKDIAETAGGAVVTPSLTTKDGGNTTLAAAGNKVDAATFTSTGAYALSSTTGVAIGGTAATSATVSAPSVDVSAITAPMIALAATVTNITLGTLTGSTSVSLTAAKDIAEAAGGAIATPSLTTKDGGNTTLAAAGNKVDAATFTSAGAYALSSTTGVAIGGTAAISATVSAPSVDVSAITAPTIALTATTADITLGTLTGSTAVTLTAAKDITETAGGTIATPSLTSTDGGNTSLAAAGNTVAAATFTSTGAYALASTTGLAIGGTAATSATVSAPSVDVSAITAPTIALTATAADITLGTLTGSTAVKLTAAKDITEAAGGTIATPSLTSTDGGNTSLAAAGNTVAAATFTSTGAYALASTTALAIGGTAATSATVSAPSVDVSAITAPTIALTATAADITLGTLTGSTAVTLTAAKDITETAGGALVTPSLTTKDGGNTTLAAAGNKVDAATFTSAGAYALSSTTGVAIGGTAAISATVSAPSVDVSAITAPTIALTATAADITLGTLTGSTAVTLTAAKDITETAGGTIATPSLTSTDGGNTSLAAAGNTVAAATFTSTGAYALASTTGLAIGGTAATSATVSAPSVDVSAITAPTIALTATAADITLGMLTGSTAVTLAAAKDIAETAGGAVVTPSLTSKDGGNTSLAAAGNQVDAASFTSAGAYALESATGVAIGGTAVTSATVSAPSVDVSAITAPTIALTATAADITLGALTGSTAMTLTAAKDIAETAGGALVTPSLTTKDGGNTTLAAAGNTVAAATFISTGAYALASTTGVAIGGTAAISATVSAPSVDVATLTAATIALTATAADITLGTLTGSTAVTLTAAKDIAETAGGAVVTPSLSTKDGGNTTLAAVGNNVDAASFTSAGAYALASTTGVAIGGTAGTSTTVSAPSVDVSAITAPTIALTATAADITLGALTGSTAVTLTAAKDIAETAGGAVVTPSLTSKDGGNTSLAAAGNQVDAASFTSAGAYALASATGVAIGGTAATSATVSASSVDVSAIIAPMIALAATVTNITLGTLTGSTSVSLTAAKDIIETLGGTIVTPLLGTTDGGNTMLATVGNKVDAAAFSSAGTYSLANTAGIGVTGKAATSVAVSAPNVNVSAITAPTITLTATGANIVFESLLGSGSVILIAATSIAEAASGAIVTPSLTTKDGGNTTLAAVGNKVDAANFTSAGTYALASTTGLAIGGTAATSATVSAPSVDVSAITAPTIALTATAADITLGTLTGSTAVTLTAAKDITEAAGGAIATPSLTSTDGGNTSLAAVGNTVAAASFTSAGAYALASTTGVAISGTAATSATVSAPSVDVSAITAPTIALTATAADITLGTLTGSTAVTLTAAKDIAETAGGALVSPSLTTKDGGNTTLAAVGNQVDAANFTSTGAYALASTTGVAIGGTAGTSATVSAPSVDVATLTAPTIALTATAADITLGTLTGSTSVVLTAAKDIVGKAAGGIETALLSGSAGGTAVTLTQPLNKIATLGAFNVANGTLSLQSSMDLSIVGPLSAELLGITATGTLQVADGVTISTVGLDRGAQAVSSKLSIPAIDALVTANLGSFLAVESVGGAATSIDIGDIVVAPLGTATKATLDVVLPPNDGGSIKIGSLKGETIDLILVTRSTGIATGTIDVASLLVLGGAGKVDLFGEVANLGGQAAANKANISPQPDANYRINACPITSVNCVLLPIQTVPPLSPLRDLPFIRDRPTQDDIDVQLPNVSDEDY